MAQFTELQVQTALKVGVQNLNDGSITTARGMKDGSAVVTLAHGKYTEAVLRGNVYCGGTAATGVAPGTAIGTTAGFSLYNPRGSGKNLVIIKASMGYVSGTLGAGVIHWLANIDPVATATTGTACVAYNCLIGGAAGAVGKPYTTATVPTPLILRPFVALGASLASTAAAPWQITDWVDGEFIVSPGCTISLHGTSAAGSTPLVAYGITWEEVSI